MQEALKMAELLCTRLCHDLTGPIGAVNNGAEFLSEEGFDLQNQAVDLIVTSAAQAVTRLQFYRMAYGKINDQGEAALSDQQKVTREFFEGGKITLDWPDSQTESSGVSISRKMARLMLNLIIIASGAMIRGGTLAIRISQPSPDSRQIKISARGPAIKWDKDVAAALAGTASLSSVTPKTVQPYLTSKLAQELSAAISIEADDASLELVVTSRQAVEEPAQHSMASEG